MPDAHGVKGRRADDADNAPIDPRIVDEAAAWLVRLHSSTVTADDRAACERWRLRSAEHARAWCLAERLMAMLGGLPPGIAMPILGRQRQVARRAALTKAAALLIALPAGWAAWHASAASRWTADYRTAHDERRDVDLADGSRMTLDASTGVDVRFDAGQRLIRLRAGGILIETAPDGGDVGHGYRPFLVDTAEGRLQALGTRFTVRQGDGNTRVAVFDGAVEARPVDGGERARGVLHAGRQALLTSREMASPEAVGEGALAWTRGMLVADGMRLADFAAELAAYRPGAVRCDSRVADLRVSGAFPVRDTDRILTMLESTYPVRVAYFSRYWVTLEPRRG